MHDSHKRKTKLNAARQKAGTNDKDELDTEKLRLEDEYQSVDVPSLIDVVFYSYCYIGILTGPYFRYRTYKDWLSNSKQADHTSWFRFMLKRGKPLPFTIAAFLVLSKYVTFHVSLSSFFYKKKIKT